MDTIPSMVPSSCRDKLEQLVSLDWFFESISDKQRRDISSLEEAVAIVLADEDQCWGDRVQHELNALRQRAGVDKDRLSTHWDGLLPEYRAWLAKSIVPPLRRFEALHAIRPRWDSVTFSAMIASVVLDYMIAETYFDGEVGFFSECIDVFLQGRCPCGYDGEYPNGRLIVF